MTESTAFQERPFTVDHVNPAVGKTTASVTCPFCDAHVTIFVWSFAGHGKKRCACGAVLYRSGVARKLMLESP